MLKSKSLSILKKSVLTTLGFIFFFWDVFTMDLGNTLNYCLETFFRNTTDEIFHAASAQLPQNRVFTPQMQSWAVFSIQFKDAV